MYGIYNNYLIDEIDFVQLCKVTSLQQKFGDN